MKLEEIREKLRQDVDYVLDWVYGADPMSPGDRDTFCLQLAIVVTGDQDPEFVRANACAVLQALGGQVPGSVTAALKITASDESVPMGIRSAANSALACVHSIL